MQILFGHPVKKTENNPVAYCWAILKINGVGKKVKNTVFEGTVLMLSLYKISKHCLLSKSISLFPYSSYLTTENLRAVLMEKPCWYF